MRIAFYAPMKPPDHPNPSGNRRMARLLMAALKIAGHEVTLASRFRAWEGTGDNRRQAELCRQGRAEADGLIERFRGLPADRRPEAWFTYHLYHKAPDWLGPAVAEELGIPYLLAEPSFAPKQADGPWDLGHQAAARAIGQAQAVIALTGHDMACLAPLAGERLVYLPPFLDVGGRSMPTSRAEARKALGLAYPGLDPDRAWLLCVAMMREGDKLQSYKLLAAALGHLGQSEGGNWQLVIVGGGEARKPVEALFGALGKEKIIFAGALTGEHLGHAYAAADIFVWPAWGEAYGMAILEAQAAGLPVIAGAGRGVPNVVRDGETALLVPMDEAEPFALDFAAAVRRLLDDPARRKVMAAAAHCFIGKERTLSHAAKALNHVLASCRNRAAP